MEKPDIQISHGDYVESPAKRVSIQTFDVVGEQLL